MAREGDQTVILGTVSWARGCASKGNPTLFQAIGPHLDWIESVIGEKIPSVET